jgi:hypothetical protein
MPAPIIAAYDPFQEDRAPVVLAPAAAELTNAPLPRGVAWEPDALFGAAADGAAATA